ncbi:MAG: hypothetical protein M3321_06915 [Actinomycetota bacterium]|nr:hypothetical protein [Actinomycetota bacterium]
MIAIPELGDRIHALWVDLVGLAASAPAPWTLIGGHMVALYAWEAGLPARPSTDADVLVDVRVVTRGTERVARYLQERGFDLRVTNDLLGHRFERDGVEIDVFAPDGLGARARLPTIRPARTISVPGGTQALARTEGVEIQSREVRGVVPRPTLLGALLVKMRAIEVDDVPRAQRADVALLLSLVEDPDPLVDEIRKTERGWLRRHPYFGNPAADAWADLSPDDAERAAIVFRRLADL